MLASPLEAARPQHISDHARIVKRFLTTCTTHPCKHKVRQPPLNEGGLLNVRLGGWSQWVDATPSAKSNCWSLKG